MSKMYKRYLELKSEDNSKIYLFKSGIFYIFLAEDAKLMSSILNLRLTNLNENILKCGFPVNNLNKYINLTKSLGLDINIVDSLIDTPIPTKNYIANSSMKDLITKLTSINANELSIREAYSLIDDLISQAEQIRKELEN